MPTGASSEKSTRASLACASANTCRALAAQAGQLAILRGLSTKEGDHGRGTYLMRTGHVPGGPVRYPAIGAALAKQLGNDESELPPYISVAPYQQFNQAAFGAGFLGPDTRRPSSKHVVQDERRAIGRTRTTKRPGRKRTPICDSRICCPPMPPPRRA